MEAKSGLGSTKSILLVEDDQVSREALAILIPRIFPGVALYTADDGNSGLQLFKEHTPDIVITDINMPELNGIQMATAISTLKPGTRFIVLTADTGKAALEEAIGTGIKFEYILKPVNFKDLIDAITKCFTAD